MDLKVSHDDRWKPKFLHLVTIALVTTFLTSNIIAFKIVEIAGFKFGAAAAIFPFSLVVGDLLSEVYGFRHTRRAILIGLACYLYFVLISQIAVALPAAPEWDIQAEYAKFLGAAPRVFFAGCMAFVGAEFVNAYVLTKLKVIQKGKRFYVRAFVAALAGELAHTGIGAPIVFGGILSPDALFRLIVTATTIKIVTQTCVLPLTCFLVSRLKEAEGVDHFDKS